MSQKLRFYYAGCDDKAFWAIIVQVKKAMYCSKCGTDNADDAVYCKKCGGLMEAEDETRIASRKPTTPSIEAMATPPQTRRGADSPDHGEGLEHAKIFSITPTVKFVMVGYVAAIVAAFLLVALVSIFLPVVGSVPAVIVGIALLLVPAFYHLRKKLVRYTLTDTMIEIDRGLVSRTTQNIPLRRVQDVTVTASVLQRMLGYGDIQIDNASETGGKVILDDIDSPKKYSELILKQMRQLDR
jgi:membrane protein YdbS with pleckstrin-like domain